MYSGAARPTCYITNDTCTLRLTFHPKIRLRALFVNGLIEAYGLLDFVEVVSPVCASSDMLKTFHMADYVDFLQKVNEFSHEELDASYDEAEEYGLGYDCPLIPYVFDVASIIAGSTITAANALINRRCSVSVNWNGGWHHAKRDEAAGFCYVNDIVLGILQLLQKFRKVLYVDLDLHHGDGVEDAFAHSKRVMCFSVHKYEDGFYPGTGSLDNVGRGKGKFYSVNIPLYDGVDDTQYINLVLPLLKKTQERFSPDVVVCQCGADTLAGDPLALFNLTLRAAGACVTELLSWNVPLMLLGGGGYNFANTARLWTYLLSLVVGRDLPPDIPEHNHFLSYGPGYELHVSPKTLPKGNTEAHLKMIMDTVLGNLEKIS